MRLTRNRATTDHRDSIEPDIADTVSEQTKSATGTGSAARCRLTAGGECGGIGSGDSIS
jgi:hypothetical protein